MNEMPSVRWVVDGLPYGGDVLTPTGYGGWPSAARSGRVETIGVPALWPFVHVAKAAFGAAA